MKFILMLFLLGQPGPQTEMAPFDTLEECEKAMADIPNAIKEHNAKADNVKIYFYAVTCQPVVRAPQGTDA